MTPEKSEVNATTNTSLVMATFSTDEDEGDGYDEEEGRECGVGACKPTSLRTCVRISVFTASVSTTALLTSTLTAYVNSQVTTLERHFGFNSAQTGLIMAANDVGFLAVVLFVSYIASQVHIPRALAVFTILFGISGVVCALPHFMFGAPSPVRTDSLGPNVSFSMPSRSSKRFSGQVCDGVNDTSSSCPVLQSEAANIADSDGRVDGARSSTRAALVVIVLGMALQGVAKAPRSAFSTLYIDNNVKKTKTGFYLGTITSIAVLGPVLAFVFGGIFSRIYVTLEDTDMHYRHPKWIGAWWLGYVVFGCASIISALPVFCFPRHMTTGKGRRQSADRRHNDSSSPCKFPAFIKGFLGAVLRLLKNPVYTLAVVSTCVQMFPTAGGLSFTAKYIENQFAFPAWRANMAIGAMLLGSGCVGTWVGGYLTKRLRMGALTSIKFVLAMQVFNTLFVGLLVAFKCDQPLLYNSPGPRSSAETNLSGCYDDCACDDNDYFPVCGDDGRSFFSPCHAGCLSNLGENYINCTCIPSGVARAGLCDYGCSMFYPFIVVMCGSGLVFTLSIIPTVIVYIRAVADRDKSLALGFSSFMASIVGWILGPICFGKLIDGICILWENNCQEDGACSLYDNDNFRKKLLGYQTAFNALSLVLKFVCLIVAKCSGRFKHEEDIQGHAL